MADAIHNATDVAGGDSRAALLWRLFVGAADRSVWVRLLAGVCAAGVAAVLAVAAPIMLKLVVDSLAAGEAQSPIWWAGLYVGALGTSRLVEQFQGYAFGTGEQRLQQRLSVAMFGHVLRLPMSFHLDRQTGGLMQTLTLGLQGARIIVMHLASSVLPVIVQAALIAVVIVNIFDLALWATAAAAMLCYGAVFAYGIRRLSAPTRAVSAAQVEAGGLFADGLVNVEPVKAFGAERQIGSRYEGLLSEAERRWRAFHARRFENGAATAVVFVITLGAVLIQGAHAISVGRITIGDFVLLNAYLLQIVRPLEMAGFALRDMAQGANYLEKWADLLRMAPEGSQAPAVDIPADGDAAQIAPSRQAPAIRFEGVSFSYGAERQVLADISFEIPRGATCAVVGPSGAGKSSLLRLLLRYYEPTAGRILIDDGPIDGLDLDRLRSMIGIVAQDTVLFNASLERNILFARPGASPEAVQRAVAQAHLQELLMRLPEGLDTLVGERGLKLSGGEKQRVAIARAALKDAPVLVFDEATSALDADTERAICSEMIEAARGRTTLIVTHRLAVAAHADEILALSGGRIVERGAHAELLAKNGVYAGLWRQQDRATFRVIDRSVA